MFILIADCYTVDVFIHTYLALFLLSSWYNEWFIHTVLLIFFNVSRCLKNNSEFWDCPLSSPIDSRTDSLNSLHCQKLQHLCMAWEEKLEGFRTAEKNLQHTEDKRFWCDSSWAPSCIHRLQESCSVLTAQRAEQSAAATCLFGGGVLCLSNTQI